MSRQESYFFYWCVSICYHEIHVRVYDKNDKRAFKNLCPIPLFSNNKICSYQKQDSKPLGRNLQTTQARYHLELTFYDFKGIHCGMFNELLYSVLTQQAQDVYTTLKSSLLLFTTSVTSCGR